MFLACEVKCQYNGSGELRLASELDFLHGVADFQIVLISQQYRNQSLWMQSLQGMRSHLVSVQVILICSHSPLPRKHLSSHITGHGQIERGINVSFSLGIMMSVREAYCRASFILFNHFYYYASDYAEALRSYRTKGQNQSEVLLF